jgi:hypothetical protein
MLLDYLAWYGKMDELIGHLRQAGVQKTNAFVDWND